MPIFGSDFGSKRAQTGIFSIVYALFTSKTYYNRFNSQKQLQARISCTIFVVGVLFSITLAIHPHSKIASQCIRPLSEQRGTFEKGQVGELSEWAT